MVSARTVTAILVPVAAVAVAAPAHADQFDFVADLDQNGIYYSSISDVIDLGKQLCSVGRSAPLDGQTMMPRMISLLISKGYKSSQEGMIIVEAAGQNMCPDMLQRLNADASVPGAGPSGYSSNSPAKATAPTTSPSLSAATNNMGRDWFIANLFPSTTIYGMRIGQSTGTDEKLVNLAREVCAQEAKGADGQDIADQLVKDGATSVQTFAENFVAASEIAFCNS